MHDIRTYIFRYNWDGELLSTYYIDGMVHLNLSVSSDGTQLYASIFNADGRQQFNRYAIPDLK